MIGKKNIVFGFIYLMFTAALGPYMVTAVQGVHSAAADRAVAMGRLQGVLDNAARSGDPDRAAAAVARADAAALLALDRQLTRAAPIDAIKAGPHAHGNLEGLLNIAAGVVLLLVSASARIKQFVSWLFILGALLHSGMLYLRVLGVGWAGTVLGTGIGPVLLLGGLLLAGGVAAFGIRTLPNATR